MPTRLRSTRQWAFQCCPTICKELSSDFDFAKNASLKQAGDDRLVVPLELLVFIKKDLMSPLIHLGLILPTILKMSFEPLPIETDFQKSEKEILLRCLTRMMI